MRNFVGLTVLVIAASPDRLALIGRYVRDHCCEIVEATNASVAEVALERVQIWSSSIWIVNPEMGLRSIRARQGARAGAWRTRPPVILLAATRAGARRKKRGRRRGAGDPAVLS